MLLEFLSQLHLPLSIREPTITVLITKWNDFIWILTLAMCRSKSTVTLRALIPYLIIYRALGLLPMKFTKKSNSKLFNFQQFRELSWWRSLNFTRIYSGCVVLLATAFLFDNLPSLESQNSSDIVGRLLEIADRSSICLNVFITSVICFCYLGKRLSILVTKMIECEQQLATIDCYLQVKDF